jgi:predicted dehydrogenase/threonine dehydrogenase-like Zn-dependent dehydrogenase
MKQVIQSLDNGSVQSLDVPAPEVRPGHLLIHTRRSLVSAGTERMLVEFGRMNLLDKARSQPERVRQVLEKVKTDGLVATFDAVAAKLDQPLALGYSSVGVVLEAGAGVTGFCRGDRVASNGKHAELVCVPRNLCARVPDGVSDEAAAFTVLAAVGLQGIRLVEPTLGECVVVTGLGLVGLLTVQLLRAQGCRVLGLDFDPARLELAASFGAEVVDLSREADPVPRARSFSRQRGVDAVLITASTRSNDPVAQAARMCRQRGRIVLVGVSGLELDRAEFFAKELSFRVSCSYGPGRYDSAYEQGGHDYPVGFVRWTEQRNFEAVLDLMAAGALDARPLVSHRFALERAAEAYDLLASDQPSLGILLEYPPAPEPAPGDDESSRRPSHTALSGRTEPSRGSTLARSVELGPLPPAGRVRVAVIGTGNHATRALIPALVAAGAGLHTAVSEQGVSARHAGAKFGFARASTDVEAVLGDPSVDALVIATRHASHARLALAGLSAGKHVFVEKPLCLTQGELGQLALALEAAPGQVAMVGFNRRFAPHVLQLRERLAPASEPKVMLMTVNAGALPRDHWVLDPFVGGGRVVGEMCHFIDLLRHLAGAPIVDHALKSTRAGGGQASDDVTLTLTFADGSLGSIVYVSSGHRSFPKERLEVFQAGRVLRLDNFRSLAGWGVPGLSRRHALKQDKGQLAGMRAFIEAVARGGPPPIPIAELLEVARVCILAQAAVSA